MRLALLRRQALLLLVLLTAPALAQEHPTLRQFRALLPPGITLSFASLVQLPGSNGGITLENAVLTNPQGRTTIESLTLEGAHVHGLARLSARNLGTVAGAPPNVASVEMTGFTMRRRPPGQTPQPDDFKLATLVMTGITAPGAPAFTIARLRMAAWGIGQRGEAEITGMEFTGIPDNPIDAMSIGRIAVSGLDMASLATTSTQSRGPGRQPAGRQSAALEAVILRGGGTVLGGLENLTIEGETDAQGTGNGRLALRGLRAERTPLSADALDAVGLDRLEASLTLEGTYDAAAGRLAIPALALGVRELGALALALRLEGWTPQAMQAQDMSAVRLRDARLRYADQSLYRRAVRQQAQRQGGGEQAVRDMHAQVLGAMLSSGSANPALDGLREVLLRFVRGEINVVELQLRPTAPVPMMGLPATAQQGAAALVRQLGLTAQGERTP